MDVDYNERNKFLFSLGHIWIASECKKKTKIFIVLINYLLEFEYWWNRMGSK